MVDRLFLQLDNPFDVSLESSLQTGKKRKRTWPFLSHLKTHPPPPAKKKKIYRDASAQPLLVVLQARSSADRERSSFSKEQEQMQHKQ